MNGRPHGRATVYSLNHADALTQLWVATERLLALTGDQVTLCGNYGVSTLPEADTA